MSTQLNGRSAVMLLTVAIAVVVGCASASDPEPAARPAFTIGSPPDDVRRYQGEPDRVLTLELSDQEVWYYAAAGVAAEHKVTMALSTHGVISWTNADGSLSATMAPGRDITGRAEFSIGSHRDDVARILGEPYRVVSEPLSGHETWAYHAGPSLDAEVTISTSSGTVAAWTNPAGTLLATVGRGSDSVGGATVSIGSHRRDVARIHGEPTGAQLVGGLDQETWFYAGPHGTADDRFLFTASTGRITGWFNDDRSLIATVAPGDATTAATVVGVGLHRDDVARIYGEPYRVLLTDRLDMEIWFYSKVDDLTDDRVEVSISTGRVVSWTNTYGSFDTPGEGAGTPG